MMTIARGTVGVMGVVRVCRLGIRQGMAGMAVWSGLVDIHQRQGQGEAQSQQLSPVRSSAFPHQGKLAAAILRVKL